MEFNNETIHKDNATFNYGIIPKEFLDFARTITVDDYEAVKHAMESKLDISELLQEMEKKFPSIHKRFMAAFNKFS
uniref:DUF655 domain-containing protein n=1 Tax=Steinernema glaseri TaxID=37863 RepID=A0A1I7Y2S1_9BILA